MQPVDTKNFAVVPIPAYQDNYIWLLYDKAQSSGVVVDPGDALPVIKTLQTLEINLKAIFVTHHHWDHCNGVTDLLKHYQVPVYGSAHEENSVVTEFVHEPQTIVIQSPALSFKVLDIPGHTRGHIAYYGHGMVFSGDTLFTAGCGRLFEGTAAQLFNSLNKLSSLPDETNVYCGHEYTVNNLRFAQTVEPTNQQITKRLASALSLRQQGLATVPGSLAIEKLTNPFLRCHVPDVIKAVETHWGKKFTDPVDVFAALRQWKDSF